MLFNPSLAVQILQNLILSPLTAKGQPCNEYLLLALKYAPFSYWSHLIINNTTLVRKEKGN